MKHYNILFGRNFMTIPEFWRYLRFSARDVWVFHAILASVIISVGAFAATSSSQGAPRVVVSIAPLHSLASAVMEGVGEPGVLLPAGTSAHDYSMRPEDARRLADADLIVWVGGEFERFLKKPMRASGRVPVIELLSVLSGLPARESGVWSAAHDDSEHRADSGHHHEAGDRGIDPHIWLDPENAKKIATIIARKLAEIDPARASIYMRNARNLATAIDQAAAKATRILAPVREIPYVVFHDAYQYFEKRFDLNAVGSIVIDPDRPPGARRLREVRKKVRDSAAACVFHEPQFKPKLVETVIRGTRAKSAALDPLGVDIPFGPDAYPQLLLRLAGQLRACLTP